MILAHGELRYRKRFFCSVELRRDTSLYGGVFIARPVFRILLRGRELLAVGPSTSCRTVGFSEAGVFVA